MRVRIAAKALVIKAPAIVLALAVLFAWRVLYARPLKTAGAYLRALASGDARAAALLASGTAAQAAARLEESETRARVEGLAISVAARGRGWARVLATVELTLDDGTPDVGWYVLDVAHVRDAWKVVAFRETEPAMSGAGIAWGKEEGAGSVLQDYLEALAANRYADAGRLLAGPARKAHEAAAFVLGKAPVIEEAEAVTLTPLWKRGKLLEARAEYLVDGRQVQVLVLFYRTGRGWRIAKVEQT